MALLQTQTASKTASAGTTATSVLSTTTANSLVVVVGVNDKGTTAGITGVTCAGMSFTKTDDILDGGGANESFWYAWGITSQTTPTLTVTFAAGLLGGAIIREYGGTFTADPLDKRTSAVGGSNNAPNSGATATLAQSNDVVIGWGGTLDSGNTYTAGAGFANATTLKIGTTLDMGMEDLTLSSSTAAQTATFAITNASFWGCGVATFFQTVVGGGGGSNKPGNLGRNLDVGNGLSRGEVAY